MPQEHATARPAIANVDRADGSQVLAAARALVEGDPGRLAGRDYAMLAAYVALHGSDPVECRRLVAGSLAASPVASRAFARLPTQMTELCIEVMRSGTEAVHELIKQYAPSEPDGAAFVRFRVYVLGRFQVLKDDAPIRFPRRQQRKPLELLQALIGFGSIEVGAAKLTDALWPDSEGDAGYHALESALYRLRLLLGAPSAVSMAGGKLTLDRRQFWVDMWAFESELRRENANDGSPAESIARMRDLYQGHFLAQETEKSWAVETRQILRERFIHWIGNFARSYERRGCWREAAGIYQVGIQVDGLVEEFHRGLIACHRELGDHGAAVRAYRRCSELLAKVLGVQPSSKTLALYHSVRHDAMAQVGYDL